MQSLQLRTSDGHTYWVKLPEPLEGINSAYLFSYHKSGSTLMDNMVQEYCRQLSVPTFSLFNAVFDSGINTNQVTNDALVCFSRTGRSYTGFRYYPRFDLVLTGAQCILLVRDPRDMLVSLYYSVAKSHVVPRKNVGLLESRQKTASMSVDDFVLRRARLYLDNFHKYQQKLPVDTLTTYRYEDVIYAKQAWLTDIVEKLSLPCDKATVKNVAKQFDIFPKAENQGKHIRQVHPGNYKTKLRPQTIESINEKLNEFLQRYDYL